MRRRVYIDPGCGFIEDCTGQVYLFDTNQPADADRRPVLRDDTLWDRYCVAREELARASAALRAALVVEPFDAVELDLARRAQALMEGTIAYDIDAMDLLEAEALSHAEALK